MGVEDGLTASLHALFGKSNKRLHKAVELLEVAVVGVEGHLDVVVLCNFAGEGGKT